MTKRSRIVRALKKALFERVPLKLFSLASAAVLFSLVSGSEDAQRSVFVEVVAILPPPAAKQVLVSELPDKVKVTLLGSRSIINTLERRDIGPVQIDLRDTNARYFYFDTSAFEIPGGLEVAQLVPASIPLRWERKVSKAVPIRPRFRGRTVSGTGVERPADISPSDAELEGPESVVHPMTAVRTEPIDLSGLSVGQYERWVQLEPLPPRSGYIGPDIVRLRFNIAQMKAEKHIVRVNIAVPKSKPSLKPRPAQVNLELRGPASLLEKLDRQRIEAYVEPPSGVGRSQIAVPVRVRGIPQGEIEVRISPPLVTLSKAP